jgi:hypothetical protein
MFLPIGDAPNPKGTPFVTYALIVVNVAAFLLFNDPLASRQADVSQLVAHTSACDRFSFEHVPRGPGLAEAYALAGMILLDERREPTAAVVRQQLAAIESLQKRRLGQLRLPTW